MRTKIILLLFLPALLDAQNFNPIIPDNVADPSISKFGDTYYLYGTTDIDRGLNEMGPPVVWKSKDFVNWSFEGTILNEIDWNRPFAYTDGGGSTTRQVFADRMEFNADGTIKTIVPGFKGVGYLGNTPDGRENLALGGKSECLEQQKGKGVNRKGRNGSERPQTRRRLDGGCLANIYLYSR